MVADHNQEIKYTKIFINNEFVDSVSGKTFPTYNPSTGEVIANVAEGDKADIDVAVAAARAAFKPGSVWRTMDASTRGKLIYKLAELIERDMDFLAALETRNNGMVIGLATAFISTSIQCLRYMAGWADKIHGDTIPVDGPFMTFTRKEPVGVVGSILPWNGPIIMVAWKLGPALATGCTLVIKPAEQTPLTALYIANLAKEAGFPTGVINVVPGYGPTAGAALARHLDVDKLAFTGSTEVGRIVSQEAATSNLKRVTLELGGKSPIIICSDVHVDEAAKIAHEAVNTLQGQICCAGSRTFVEAGVYDKFIEKAKELATSRVVGDPSDPNVQQGPQIDEIQLDKIKELVESGKKEGAKLICGGSQIGTKGFFFQPTIFVDVKDDMRIAQEEIFGPVQQILKFDSLDEAIERANATNYGLAAGIITKDINKALTFVQKVRAGTVWVNTYNAILAQAPFGGYKESGHGREQGPDGLAEYLETKTVTIAIAEKH